MVMRAVGEEEMIIMGKLFLDFRARSCLSVDWALLCAAPELPLAFNFFTLSCHTVCTLEKFYIPISGDP
jgi:hypothetical protein